MVYIDNVFSAAGAINYGVSRGSILEPLLFLLYVNALPQSLSEVGFYLYADDTYIFYQHEDVKSFENVLSKEFLSLCQWFIDNKLSIHFGDEKTRSTLPSRTRGLREINVSFPGYSILASKALKKSMLN